MCCGQLVKKRDFMSMRRFHKHCLSPAWASLFMEPAIDDGVKSRFLTLSATHCPSQASAFATQKRRAYLSLNSHTHANIFIQLY